MTDRNIDILVIGAGPAGLAAAIAAREAGIDSLLVIDREKDPAGYSVNVYITALAFIALKKSLRGLNMPKGTSTEPRNSVYRSNVPQWYYQYPVNVV